MSISRLGLATCAAMFAALTAGTGAQPSQSPLGTTPAANFDIRLDKDAASAAQLAYLERRTTAAAPAIAAAAQARDTAVARLKAIDRAVAVDLHPALGVPEIVSAMPGSNFLSPPSTDRVATLRAFVAGNADVYAVGAGEAQALEVTADYANPEGGMAWVELQQSFNGIPVFQGTIRGGFTAKGELVRTTGLLASSSGAPLATTPGLSSRQALAGAAASLGWPLDEDAFVEKGLDARGHAAFTAPGLTDDAKAWLVYFPLSAGVVRLAWAAQVIGDPLAYLTVLDAQDGTVLFRKSLTSFQSQAATYRVYTSDSPAPLSPTTATPGSNTQPPTVPTTLVTTVGNESPNTFNNLGWITDGQNVTDGNNVEAGLDINGSDGVDAPIAGSALRVFDFAYNPAPGSPGPGDAPSSAGYRNGEITNMFYWSNVFHDRLYRLGFTEAARNFQHDNFGRGGAAADRVRAEAQDSAGTNNANFMTPVDGTRGRMQMYVFTGPTPDRSSGIDQDILLHELTHGVSNRLHADATGLGTAEADGLGEGWSDFFARALLATADEDVNGAYTTGGWATLQFNGTASFTDNYYYGIRRFPYAVKTNVGPNGRPHNPLTLADIDPTKIDLSDGAFASSTVPDYLNARSVHNMGEVWSMALLEGRARLITRLGFAAGNQKAMQFVIDGMKLDPINPTFLQARDAVLAAANAGGTAQDVADLWAGFAARGMGVFAEENGTLVTENFLSPSDPLPTFSINDVAVVEGDSGTTTANFTVTLTNPMNATHTVLYETVDASATSSTFTFTNATPIAIPVTGTIGPSAPYPATVTVAGVPGTIVRVGLRLNGLTHTFPSDLDVLLVSPTGQKVLVMSDIGAGNDVSNISLTLRDGALVPPAVLTTGIYRPTNLSTGDTFPATAPVGPYDETFAAFNGANPNGTWSLYIVDDTSVDVGTLAGGFSLLVTTTGTGDYTPTYGELEFPPGTTTRPISVTVNGDTAVESSETFVVNLAAPHNAVLGDAQGVGTIVADEGPQPPTGLFVSSMVGNRMTLRFTPPGAGPAPTGYLLEGGVAPGSPFVSLPTGSTAPIYTIDAPSGAFYVRMRTQTAAGPSGPSNEIRVFINVPTPPSAPANLLASVAGNTLSLAWRNTFEGGAPTIVGLQVSGSINGVLPLGLVDHVTVSTVPGGTYTIQALAANGGGISPPSNAVTVTVPTSCTGAPLTPVNFLAYRKGQTVSIVWDPASSGAAPSSYVLTVTGTASLSVPLTARSLTANAPPGTFNISVHAINACGASAPTATQQIVVP